MVMFIEIFPYTNRFTAFRPRGLFSAYPCISVFFYAPAKKNAKRHDVCTNAIQGHVTRTFPLLTVRK